MDEAARVRRSGGSVPDSAEVVLVECGSRADAARRGKAEKDWRVYPKFRHNLWATFDDRPEITYLTVSHGTFEVPTADARRVLEIRSHCTGHNTIETIAERSGVDAGTVARIVVSLHEAGMTRPPYRPFASMTEDDIREVLFAACHIWGEQLCDSGIRLKLARGKLPRSVVVGWLLEMNHYLRAFPAAVAVAARHATGELKAVLDDYTARERGYAPVAIESLSALGLAAAEIQSSIPLVSTRLIDLLMRELFTIAPCSALLLGAIVEARNPKHDEVGSLFKTLSEAYDVSPRAFTSIQRQMMIDAQRHRARLATEYSHLIALESEEQLHEVVNKLHDIKHAFDLQQLEIEEYYNKRGNYIPRQYVDFFGI
jgi:hypothetical protein